MTKSEIAALAIQAGFDGNNDCGRSGVCPDDTLVYVDEHPVGSLIIEFARLLGVEIEED